MTTAAIISLVLQYGPNIIPLVQQLVAWAEGGKTTLTSEDLALLVKLGNTPSSAYLAAAGGPPIIPPVVPVA
jgi:hypothetical protein